MKTWKRRWFILTDNCLYYFEYTTVSVAVQLISEQAAGERLHLVSVLPGQRAQRDHSSGESEYQRSGRVQEAGKVSPPRLPVLKYLFVGNCLSG